MLVGWCCFNPRSREGSDQQSITTNTHNTGFNPRSREGSDSKLYSLGDISRSFQSTLPRGERPFNMSSHSRRIFVSIHAPARGATAAPPRTHPDQRPFQSTLPRGERLHDPDCAPPGHPVSIHAPARGATFTCLLSCFPFKCFNPRSREGSDNQF